MTLPTTLQEASEYLTANPDQTPTLEESSFVPSKLGTREHWDEVYEREVKMFKEIGDEGEVWFGEDSTEKMVEWIEEHLPDTDASILDVGTGNGQLLFRLSEQGYRKLTGIDYSEPSIELARSIQSSKLSSESDKISFKVHDILASRDLEQDGISHQRWSLITDKGTYDAICLSDQIDTTTEKKIGELYPGAIARLLREGDRFLITSCNWTRAELQKAFITPETGLVHHSHVSRPVFSFGGSSGSSITTIAFVKDGPPRI